VNGKSGASLPQPGGVATGIVLAGGRSSRFGSDKLAAEYRGMPLLHHAVLRLAEVTCDVVVVLAPGSEAPQMPPGVQVRFVHDAAGDQGPLEGALAGLSATETDLAVLVGGDMPEVATAVVIEMLRVAAGAPIEAVALADGERFPALPLVVRVDIAREAAHALRHSGEHRLRALPQALRTAVIDETTWHVLDPGRTTLRDIDAPRDLEAEDGTGDLD
jgi:molybdopterin-guanine dinucleotide biosynthesis protein A